MSRTKQGAGRLTYPQTYPQAYPQADIGLARKQQEAEKRAGVPLRPLEQILLGKPVRMPTDMTDRQLRRRGRYGQAALLADQEALTEKDLGRASEARAASGILKKLAKTPPQLEFSYFGRGNVSFGHEYFDAMLTRLKAAGVSGSERRAALAMLAVIVRHLGWQTYECTKTAVELGEMLDMAPPNVAPVMTLLERIGGITRVKRGRTKVITITPEGAYRGDIARHAETMDRYRADVVPLRRQAPDQPPAA